MSTPCNCSENMWNTTCPVHTFPPGLPEGVAAPLEPSQERLNFVANLEHDWIVQQHILDFRNWLIEKLWVAAAVSKNLTDKYAEMEAKWMRELLTVSNEIGEARERISDLLNHDGGPGSIDYDAAKVFRARAKLLEFREIAALRETKL